MLKINKNQQNYLMACNLSVTTNAMQELMKAGVAVKEVRIVNGRSYIKTTSAADVNGVMPIASIETRKQKKVRALLLGCVIEWVEIKDAQEQAA